MKTLIIGNGQVGKALFEVLSPYYGVTIADKHETALTEGVEIIHVCFNYDENFVNEVLRYQGMYNPKYTVIHSTVPVGTCKKLWAIHSPIIGIHPFLAESIKTFVKMLGGEKAGEVADYFRRASIKVYLYDKSETTELFKVVDTTFYGLCVEYTKEIKRQCKKYNVPFEAWTLYNQFYNQGYQKLGYPEYTRPELIPIMNRIGGHCVIPNCEMLQSKFTRFIKKLNK